MGSAIVGFAPVDRAGGRRPIFCATGESAVYEPPSTGKPFMIETHLHFGMKGDPGMILYRLVKWAEEQERASAAAGESEAEHLASPAAPDGNLVGAIEPFGIGGMPEAAKLDVSSSMEGAALQMNAASFGHSPDMMENVPRGAAPRTDTNTVYDRPYVSGLGAAFDRAAAQAMPWLFAQTGAAETKNGDRL
mgnify:FL=1